MSCPVRPSIIIALLISLSWGCASNRPRDHVDSASGYEHEELEPGFYRVWYYGVPYDSDDHLREMWQRRVVELCGSESYDGYPGIFPSRQGYTSVSSSSLAAGPYEKTTVTYKAVGFARCSGQ